MLPATASASGCAIQHSAGNLAPIQWSDNVRIQKTGSRRRVDTRRRGDSARRTRRIGGGVGRREHRGARAVRCHAALLAGRAANDF